MRRLRRDLQRDALWIFPGTAGAQEAGEGDGEGVKKFIFFSNSHLLHLQSNNH